MVVNVAMRRARAQLAPILDGHLIPISSFITHRKRTMPIAAGQLLSAAVLKKLLRRTLALLPGEQSIRSYALSMSPQGEVSTFKLRESHNSIETIPILEIASPKLPS